MLFLMSSTGPSTQQSPGAVEYSNDDVLKDLLYLSYPVLQATEVLTPWFTLSAGHITKVWSSPR